MHDKEETSFLSQVSILIGGIHDKEESVAVSSLQLYWYKYHKTYQIYLADYNELLDF